MTSPRPIRIPRSVPATTPTSESTGAGAVDSARTPATVRHPNRGGTQRAVRLTGVYLGCLAALYLGFLLLDRTVPGGTSSPAGNGLFAFSALAGLLAVGGTLLSLHPAPR